MHISTSVTPEILWDLAHEQGIKLPTKDYFEFARSIVIDKAIGYDKYLGMYDLLEEIQSNPETMFHLAEMVSTHLYQRNHIDLIEVRMNPMLRSRNGKVDLDHIIVFTLQGLERATLKFPLKTGLILSMDRRFTHKQNEIIVDKAIKYRDRGVVGIDLAGSIDNDFHPRDIADIVEKARENGLGVTIHTGEVTGPDEMWEVIEHLRPNRIGHGVTCVKDKKLMEFLRENNIVLETCPTSNLKTRVVRDMAEMKKNYKILLDNNVPFTINTDGPILQNTTLPAEYELLLNAGIITLAEAKKINQRARNATFIK